MNFVKFFDVAKSHGISESQIQFSKSTSLSFSLFRHEVDSYEVSESQNTVACGFVNGKFGSCGTQKLDKGTFDHLAKGIIESAKFSEKEGETSLFKGSKKYKHYDPYDESLLSSPAIEKLDKLRKLEDLIYSMDESISEVEVSYSESSNYSAFYNSYGLKLKRKSNLFFVYASVVARKGEEVQNASSIVLGNDLSMFDIDAIAKEAVSKAMAKFGASPIPSKKYPVVISREIMPTFIGAYVASSFADSVQRHTSFFEGKLGQKVASSKLTIEEKPLQKGLFFCSFDDEGVACQNKAIVKGGVLKIYLYNRETAKKDGVETTGNGFWSGGKISTDITSLVVKPGKVSFEELIAPIKDGVFITDVAGMHAGMNPVSGDFSCQAEGFRIRDGKIAEPINLITLSGNLLKMFQDLKGFDKETFASPSGITTSDAFIRSMNIGGK